jgi:hypothetical protein
MVPAGFSPLWLTPPVLLETTPPGPTFDTESGLNMTRNSLFLFSRARKFELSSHPRFCPSNTRTDNPVETAVIHPALLQRRVFAGRDEQVTLYMDKGTNHHEPLLDLLFSLRYRVDACSALKQLSGTNING